METYAYIYMVLSAIFCSQYVFIGININKTVNAAVKQIDDIRLIQQRMGFEQLNEGLAQIAELRMQYPEATLKELGMMLSPQVGKSGVNHRLRKLSAMADELREKQGGEVL